MGFYSIFDDSFREVKKRRGNLENGRLGEWGDRETGARIVKNHF